MLAMKMNANHIKYLIFDGAPSNAMAIQSSGHPFLRVTSILCTHKKLLAGAAAQALCSDDSMRSQHDSLPGPRAQGDTRRAPGRGSRRCTGIMGRGCREHARWKNVTAQAHGDP